MSHATVPYVQPQLGTTVAAIADQLGFLAAHSRPIPWSPPARAGTTQT